MDIKTASTTATTTASTTATQTISLCSNYVILDMRSNGVVLNLGVYQDRQHNRGVAVEIFNIGPPCLHLSNEDNTLGTFVFC